MNKWPDPAWHGHTQSSSRIVKTQIPIPSSRIRRQSPDWDSGSSQTRNRHGNTGKSEKTRHHHLAAIHTKYTILVDPIHYLVFSILS